jgi:hypothetical protein
LSFHTFSYFVLGQPEKALETSSRAVELLEQAGDVWEGNMARMFYCWSHFYLGNVKTAYQQMQQVFATAGEVGDYSARAITLWLWMQIHPESAPDGEMQVEFERPREDPTTTALAIQGRGLEILFREDKPLEAAQVIQDSLDLAKKKSIRNVTVFAGATWKVVALRIAAEREPVGPTRCASVGCWKSSPGAKGKLASTSTTPSISPSSRVRDESERKRCWLAEKPVCSLDGLTRSRKLPKPEAFSRI